MNISNRHEMFVLMGAYNERLIASNKILKEDSTINAMENFDFLDFTRSVVSSEQERKHDHLIFADGVRIFSKEHSSSIKRLVANTEQYFTNPRILTNEPNLYTGNLVFGKVDRKSIKIINDINPDICRVVNIKNADRTNNNAYNFGIKILINKRKQNLTFGPNTFAMFASDVQSTYKKTNSILKSLIPGSELVNRIVNGTFNVPSLIVEFRFNITVTNRMSFSVNLYLASIFNTTDDSMITSALMENMKDEYEKNKCVRYLKLNEYNNHNVFVMPWPFGNVSANYIPCMDKITLNMACVKNTLFTESIDGPKNELILSVSKLYNMFYTDFFESCFNNDILRIHPMWMSSVINNADETDEEAFNVKKMLMTTPRSLINIKELFRSERTDNR